MERLSKLEPFLCADASSHPRLYPFTSSVRRWGKAQETRRPSHLVCGVWRALAPRWHGVWGVGDVGDWNFKSWIFKR